MDRKSKTSAKTFTAAILIMLLSLPLFGTVGVSLAQNSTPVGGILSSNVTWSKANNPYTLTSPLTVANGVTLTIEPGITVTFNGYTIQVNGVLNARGTSQNPIIFSSDPQGSGNIEFSSSSTNWDAQTGKGCIIEYATLNAVSVAVDGSSPLLNHDTITAPAFAADQAAIVTNGGSPTISNSIITGDLESLDNAAPQITNNTITGGIFGMGMLTSKPVITNNHITGGSFHSYGTGIRCDGSSSYVADNVVSNCKIGIEIYDGSSTIERNLIYNCTKGIAVTAFMSPVSTSIRNNTIANNLAGFNNTVNFSSLTFSYNNVENNSKLEFNSANAINNWWGTTNEASIRQMLPENISFTPYLSEPNPQATPLPYVELTPTNNTTGAPTQISIFVDAASALAGQTVYISGKLTDTNRTALQGKSVVLSYTLEGDNSAIPIGSDLTNPDGEYLIQWVNAASGTFTLRTQWNGDAYYQPASNATTLSFVPYQNKNVFFVESNSTVSALAFNSTASELSFSVSGPTGTTGYVKATIAKTLLANGENLKITLDGNQLQYTLTSNPGSWLLAFTYNHSTHEVKVSFPAANAPNPTQSTLDYWVWIAAAVAAVCLCIAAFGVWKTTRKTKST
jgi:parallel beta-helix repeat protein